jgi:hypothetical protein
MFRSQRSAAAVGALVSSAEPGRENRVGRNSSRAGATISAGWHWHHARDDPHDRAPITGHAWYGDQTVDVHFPDDWNVIAHWPRTPRPLDDDDVLQAHYDDRVDSFPFGSWRVAGADQ